MSDDDWGFAPPPFNAEQALVSIKRSLRDLGLSERGNGFELRAKAAVRLAVEDGAVAAALVRRLGMTPEWDRQRIQSGADQRKWLDEVRRRLERWQRDD
jgi:hypothetical protein